MLYFSEMISIFRTAGELESDSVALERIREYEDLPQEQDWHTEQPLPEVIIFTCKIEKVLLKKSGVGTEDFCIKFY